MTKASKPAKGKATKKVAKKPKTVMPPRSLVETMEAVAEEIVGKVPPAPPPPLATGDYTFTELSLPADLDKAMQWLVQPHTTLLGMLDFESGKKKDKAKLEVLFRQLLATAARAGFMSALLHFGHDLVNAPEATLKTAVLADGRILGLETIRKNTAKRRQEILECYELLMKAGKPSKKEDRYREIAEAMSKDRKRKMHPESVARIVRAANID